MTIPVLVKKFNALPKHISVFLFVNKKINTCIFILQTSMSASPIMEAVHKTVPIPLEASYAHAMLVIH